MAITQDGWFVATFVAAMNNDIALDMTSSTFKFALFQDALTVDFSQTSPAYGTAPFDANEVSGAGYTAGGLTLASVVFEEHPSTPGYARWDFANLSWTSSTIPDAKGALLYASSLSNVAVMFRNFGQAYSSQDGTFAVTVPSDGVAKSNLVATT